MVKGAPKVILTGCEAAVHVMHNRMPFRYGAACLTAAPVLLVRVHVRDEEGNKATGYAADCLPPLWFDKDLAKDYRRNVEDQILAFRIAREIYLLLGSDARTAGELWDSAYPRVLDEAQAADLNALTGSFGSSFFERAVIDALCRLNELSFFDALRNNLLGFDTASHLPEKPVTVMGCRHTVGLGDPITAGEIPADDRLDDGLPQALEEDIDFYGLRYFKVKVRGDHDADLARLTRIAALVAQRCPEGYSITLDGNEQYGDLRDLSALLKDLRGQPYGEEFFDAILFIEQPLSRDRALNARAAAGVAELSKLKPIIIDESDDRRDSFERAVKLGYRGISHKNCKGIFKSLQTRARILELNREHGEGFYFQSGEDLANSPVIPVQQDLATLAALGITHAERNGHHYYHGLDHLPRSEAESAFATHPDLYEERQGSVFLRIEDGLILCESLVNAVGYGYASEIAFDERTPLDDWKFNLDR